MDMDAYVYMKQRKSIKDGGAVFFDIKNCFISPDMWPGKLQMKKRSCKPLIMIVKGKGEIGTSMLHSKDYSRIDNGTQVCLFLQGIKSTELEKAVNVVRAQPEKYGTDFNATVSYMGQMVTKKDPSMQSIHIVRTKSQPVKAEVMAFTSKVGCKKYPKAV